MFFLVILNFSSARLLTKNDPEYYFEALGDVNLKYPIYYDSEELKILEDFQNYMHFSLDFKFENRIKDDFILTRGWYRNTTINEVLFRDFVLENGELFKFGFKNYYGETFYAQFIVDFRLGDTTYFSYGNYNFFSLPEITYIGLDFPTLSYLSYKKDDYSFLIGRMPLSYGTMKYNLVLSDNSAYYDTFNLSYNFSHNINYDFAMLSMVPMLSQSEYDKQRAIDEDFVSLRNAFYNGLNYNYNEKIFVGISSLNQVAGKLPNPINVFLKSDVGIFGSYIKVIPFYNINLDAQYAINYETLSNAYAFGISKTFDLDFSKFKLGFERYTVSDNFFSNEEPYKNLYYRTIALSNTPGARIFFDYPFGFKYGENAHINSFDLTFAVKNGYLKYVWDNGTNSYGDLNSNELTVLFDTKIGDFKMSWHSLKNGEDIFETFNLAYIIEVDFKLR
ncbi:hypothetical protein [Petrotoga sp. 9PWA.NaAc.5.4]|uniref:hypothetical protein n=1 Tax=Petrotoga sp. 9PWA.NaAc.5.4 TaxID=1434328 RepID=UPI000CBB5B2E|nr:hypothetical protein [Petrotoga sp. 9PWA.NaAc.5.4]PNR95399.1 hypothetical protein X924_04915 [Petrotoga sp. 9PWA.NaAc.5.4]